MARITLTSLLDDHRSSALLLARLLVAFIFLWHGGPKALDVSMAYDKFVGFGLPGVLGPITGWVEVIASALLIAGFKHRWASLALAVVIVGALVTVQIPAGFTAGLERDLLILAGTLVLATHGPGRFAVDQPVPTPVALASAA